MPHAASLLQALPLPLYARVVRVGVGVLVWLVVRGCLYVSVCCCLRVVAGACGVLVWGGLTL
jgi:hypothetical protein